MNDDTEAAEDAAGDARRERRKLWAFRAGGIVAGGVVWWLLGSAQDLAPDARAVAAVATLMAVWWMTEAAPLPVTSLLPIVLLPVFADIPVANATQPYASSIVFFFAGGFLIAIAMERWGLHRRIALAVLTYVGVAPRRIVLGIMIASGFLSMWVSNVATTLMMLPIGMSILSLLVDRSESEGTSEDMRENLKSAPLSEVIHDPNIRGFAICLTLAIAWSASIGGLATLLGSTPNAIVAGYAADELGRDFGFFEWMLMGLPLSSVFLVIAWLLMTRVLYPFDLAEIPGGASMIRSQRQDLGAMSQGEWMVTIVFVGAATFWVVPGLLANFFGLTFLNVFDDTAIAMSAGIALFLLPATSERMTLTWKDAEDGLPWGVLLLFGGGLTLASAFSSTGLDQWFGNQVTALGALPRILLIAAICGIVLLLTEITSNTATAATFIPILGGVAAGIGAEPLTLLVPAALAATCAFMLPVSTPPNAIVFGTGNVTIAQMARGGAVMNVTGICLITLMFYFIGSRLLGAG